MYSNFTSILLKRKVRHCYTAWNRIRYLWLPWYINFAKLASIFELYEWMVFQPMTFPAYLCSSNEQVHSNSFGSGKGQTYPKSWQAKKTTSSIFNILARLERGSSTLKCWYNLKFPYNFKNFLTRSKISVGMRQFLYNLFFYIWIYDDTPPPPALYAIWLVSRNKSVAFCRTFSLRLI